MHLRFLTIGVAAALSAVGLAAGSYWSTPAHAASMSQKVNFSAKGFGTLTGTIDWGPYDCSATVSLTVTSAANEPPAQVVFTDGTISSKNPAPDLQWTFTAGKGTTYHTKGTFTDPFVGSPGGCNPWTAGRFNFYHGKLSSKTESAASSWYLNPGVHM